MVSHPTFFCPRCHAELAAGTGICPGCGQDLDAWSRQPYEERLVAALGHPLSEVRMAAIISLGKRRSQRAAAALVDCAFAHARDPVQGLEIITAVAALPRGAARRWALARLCMHPARVVARAALDAQA